MTDPIEGSVPKRRLPNSGSNTLLPLKATARAAPQSCEAKSKVVLTLASTASGGSFGDGGAPGGARGLSTGMSLTCMMSLLMKTKSSGDGVQVCRARRRRLVGRRAKQAK